MDVDKMGVAMDGYSLSLQDPSLFIPFCGRWEKKAENKCSCLFQPSIPLLFNKEEENTDKINLLNCSWTKRPLCKADLLI